MVDSLGFDLALLKSRLLGQRKPLLLICASSGAMRIAAWMQPEAEKSYRKLSDAYISMPLGRRNKPTTALSVLINVINAYLEDNALSFALANKQYRLTVTTAKVKNLFASELQLIQR